METIKNIQFTERFKAGGRLREFNFRKSNSISGLVFTVDVADEKGNRYYAMFGLKDSNWRVLTNNVQEWIKEVLPQIQAALEPYS